MPSDVIAGGALLLLKVMNVSLSGMAISISITVPFLNMTKQFVEHKTVLHNISLYARPGQKVAFVVQRVLVKPP